MCHVSYVTFYISHVTCHMSHFFVGNLVELVGGRPTPYSFPPLYTSFLGVSSKFGLSPVHYGVEKGQVAQVFL